MLDRASTFSDPDIIAMLQTRFVPVAVDVWYEERRQDPAGKLYRRIVNQRDGMRPGRTTQGFYLFTPTGDLLQGWNNRDVRKVKRRLRKALASYTPPTSDPVGAGSLDRRFERTPPVGAVVVDVFSRIVKASWPPSQSRWDRVQREATGRDHLWLLPAEITEIVAGRWPATVTRRIARFHVIDNTRGEPPMWRSNEVTAAALKLESTADGYRLVGKIQVKSRKGDRGCDAALLGRVRVKEGRLTRLDIVARGSYFGHGRYTGGAPPGSFTLAVAFRLADPKATSTRVPPQGSRDLNGYLRAR
ncbi:MAG: hypothetical protein CMJ83_02785 [Planctomycetes bacterium]|nr:hypothetical protein [Planctomycetota bacterium]